MKLSLYLSTLFFFIHLFVGILCDDRWANFHYDSASSPFHKNKDMLKKQFLNLIAKGEETNAMNLVKIVVRIEKAWRYRFCTRIFGFGNCSDEDFNPNPFFMWKRRMIHEVRQDPSSEIFNYFRTSLSLFLKNS